MLPRLYRFSLFFMHLHLLYSIINADTPEVAVTIQLERADKAACMYVR